MSIRKNSMVILPIFLVCFFAVACCLNAQDQVAANTADILTKYKTRMMKLEKAKIRFARMQKRKLLAGLKSELTSLTKAADLDRAIAVRDLIRGIEKDGNIPDIADDDKNYSKNTIKYIKTYQAKVKRMDEVYLKNKNKIKDNLAEILNDEMINLHKTGAIGKSLNIKQIIEKVKMPEFDLANYNFVVKKAAPKPKIDDKKETKKPKKPEINYDEQILKTALALGNNILSENISSEKGLVYLCFAESINPEWGQLPQIRRKIEKKSYLTIMPCSMTEEDFLSLLEKATKKLLKEKPDHQHLLKYCALLCHFKPELKKTKEIDAYIAKSGKANNVAAIMNYDKTMFGGTAQAEEIQLKIDKNKPELIVNLLDQAKKLQIRFPKNQDVNELVNELAKIKAGMKTVVSPDTGSDTYVKCIKCQGSGWIDTPCPLCKGKKGSICDRCIGSGICYSQVECDTCKGKGKNWLGMTCKECQGTGKIKKKKVCPDCSGEGKKVCPECKNKGIVRKQCPVCYGQGKVKK